MCLNLEWRSHTCQNTSRYSSDLDPLQNGPPKSVSENVHGQTPLFGPIGCLHSLADLESPRVFGPPHVIYHCVLSIV